MFRLFKNHCGFSFLELSLTLLLMATVGLYIGPGVLAELNSNLSLDTAARTLASNLRYVQSLARTTGYTHGFKANNPKTYMLYKQEQPVGISIINSPHDQQPMSIDITLKHPGIDFISPSFPLEVQFKGDSGSPPGGTGITIVLENNQGEQKWVVVDEVTGNVEVTDPGP